MQAQADPHDIEGLDNQQLRLCLHEEGQDPGPGAPRDAMLKSLNRIYDVIEAARLEDERAAAEDDEEDDGAATRVRCRPQLFCACDE